MSRWSYVAGKPARDGRPSSQVRVYERLNVSHLHQSRLFAHGVE